MDKTENKEEIIDTMLTTLETTQTLIEHGYDCIVKESRYDAALFFTKAIEYILSQKRAFNQLKQGAK